MLQVLTCQDIVGWREETRDEGSRVVLFVTDNGFHFAGEGVVSLCTDYSVYTISSEDIELC